MQQSRTGDDRADLQSQLSFSVPTLLLTIIMAYPGDGYHMSSYGVKTFTPEEEKEQWREHVEREAKATRGRRTRRSGRSPLEEEGTRSYNPVSYFGNGKEHQKATTYDKLVHIYRCLTVFV